MTDGVGDVRRHFSKVGLPRVTSLLVAPARTWFFLRSPADGLPFGTKIGCDFLFLCGCSFVSVISRCVFFEEVLASACFSSIECAFAPVSSRLILDTRLGSPSRVAFSVPIHTRGSCSGIRVVSFRRGHRASSCARGGRPRTALVSL